MTFRGCRGALAYPILSLISALNRGGKVGLYCVDLAGAFDRVKAERPICKLRTLHIHPKMIKLIESWLEWRRAHVIVGGELSEETRLADMVFQGTVLGPVLWNPFYGDSARAIRSCNFGEITFADDLNSFKPFCGSVSNAETQVEPKRCQTALHTWGFANQAIFVSGKESHHIISHVGPFGANFKILGITFDPRLSMKDCINEIVSEYGWKIQSLLRVQRSYSIAELIRRYNAHVLSRVACRTAVISHSPPPFLEALDRMQRSFLRSIGLS